MDLMKIGKFIAEQRKAKNLTQSELGQKLGVSDRAVSKWERGLCLPDASLMISLRDILDISLNELLTGEKLSMENNFEFSEKNLVELAKNGEWAGKMLLLAEKVILALIIAIVLGAGLFSERFAQSNLEKGLAIGAAVLLALAASVFCVFIEGKTGYYECSCCGKKYRPKMKSVFFAQHFGTIRYMKCPECGKKSWHKKVLK